MKKTLVILLFLFLTTPTFAIQETVKISLKEAIDIALSTNPQIKMAKLDVETAKNNIKAVSGFKNPSIYTTQNIGAAGKGNPQEIGVDYTVEILKRGKRKQQAKSQMIVASDNQKFQEYNLILNVKTAYFDVLHKKNNMKLINEQKDISYEFLKNAQNEAKKGLIPQTDVIQAKIDYNRAVVYSNIAKSELVKSHNRFNTIMNSKSIDYDTKEDELSVTYEQFGTINPKNLVLDFVDIKNYALENRFDLIAAKQDIQTAQNNLSVVKSQLIPDLQFQGGYLYQTKGMSERNRFDSGAFAGVNLVNIPLVYHYQPEIKNAKIAIEKAELKYEDLKIDITRDITDAWEKFIIAKDNLIFYNSELLSNSKELINESIKSLNKKEIDFTAYLVSKKTYVDLILGYYEAVNEYYVSYAELLKEMNIDDIDQLNQEKISSLKSKDS